MTTPLLKIKVFPKPVIKGKMDVRFPANVQVEKFLTLNRANGVYTFDIDYTLLDSSAVVDPTTTFAAVFDQNAGLYKIASLSALLASISQIEQHITDPGPVAIDNNTGIVRVDQAVGAAIELDMPDSSAKTCPVLISDWKADSGTNPITVNLTGSDTFPGGLTSWTINADGASIFLRPIPGVGYAL
jgi:hypothetical protein